MGDNSIQRLVIQFIMLLRSPAFVHGIGNRGGTLGGGIQDDEDIVSSNSTNWSELPECDVKSDLIWKLMLWKMKN